MKGEIAGWHLSIQALVEESFDLGDPEVLRAVLLEVFKLCELEPIVRPLVREAPRDATLVDADPIGGGLIGFSRAELAYLSVHIWPEHNRLLLDLFSCKSFDDQLVAKYVTTRLRATKYTAIVLEREWPC